MPKRPRQQAARPISLAAAARRPRWREEHARVVVAAWRDSGMTMREFALGHGLPLKRLENWCCKLRKKDEAQPKEPLHFLPIKVAAPTEVSPAAGERHGTDTMDLVLPAGMRVVLGAGFDAAALKRLLEAVGC
jgi:hypothetical protein